MPLSESDVLALAPDAASVKAAQGLVKPAKWSDLGATPQAVWGACQGSGSKPYQTQADLSGAAPSFKCSCPSHKFPCKHGLALLLLQASQSALFTEQQPPQWVTEWLQGRAEKAQKKEEKQRQAEEKAAAKAAALAADPAAAAKAAAAAQAAAEKSERQRWARIDAGVADLRQWLQDQLAHGIGNLAADDTPGWHTQAARLVDAQAPLLAQRLRDAAALIRVGEHWPERLLAALGLLQLACDAVAQRERLAPGELADLRSLVLGWPQDKAQVQASGQPVADHWLVLGQVQQEREANLTERRVWLQGRHSGRLALLLDHAYAGKGYDSLWQTGSSVPATLVFYASAAPQRALLLPESPAPAADAAPAPPAAAPAAAATPAPPAGAAPSPPAQPGTSEWARIARHIAACPWTPLHPWRSPAARIGRVGDGFVLFDADLPVPLSLSDADGWALLALSGGQPLQLHAEWDGHSLRPLWARAAPEALHRGAANAAHTAPAGTGSDATTWSLSHLS